MVEMYIFELCFILGTVSLILLCIWNILVELRGILKDRKHEIN